MQDIQLNTWYQGEAVEPADMLLINQAFIQTMFAGNGGTPQIIGGAITVNGNNFNIAKGFVYYGESSDPTYISRTGTNQLCSVILAQGGLSLVNVNCYIYVNYVITYNPDNRGAIITANVYSSVNPNDAGIKICDIVNSVPTNYTNNNITNYFKVGVNNTLVASDPSNNPFSLQVKNFEATGTISSNGAAVFGLNNNGGENKFITNSVTYPGYSNIIFGSDTQSGILTSNGTINGQSNTAIVNHGSGLISILAKNSSYLGDGSYSTGGEASYINHNGALFPKVSNYVQFANSTNEFVNMSSNIDNNKHPTLEISCGDTFAKTGLFFKYDHSANQWFRPGLITQSTLSTEPDSIALIKDLANNVRVKTYYVGSTQMQLNAIWNGTNWGCNISGTINSQETGSTQQCTNTINLFDTLGVTVNNAFEIYGTAGTSVNTGLPALAMAANYAIGGLNNNLNVGIVYVNLFSGGFIPILFNATFIATSIIP